MVGLTLVTAAGPTRWFVGVVVLPVCGAVQKRRQQSATTAHRALLVCEWAALGMPWGTERSNAASAVLSSCDAVCNGCCSRGLGRWFVGVVVLLVLGISAGGGSTWQPQRTEPC